MATPTINEPDPWIHPYIAARFNSNELPEVFVLGDGMVYDTFKNQPLRENIKYHVFLRAHSIKTVMGYIHSYKRG